MRIDLVVPNEGPVAPEALRAAPQFEAMGYDGLWFTDHVIGLKAYEPVYGDYWLEVVNTLAYAAAITKRVRLGIGVLVIPYRDPVLTAKSLATIDLLSNGRVDLGVGTGWSRTEFHALGRGELFESRGAATDEALEVMQRCWSSEGELAFEGRYSSFRKVRFEPRPVQKPRIPLWIGARGIKSAAPLRRAAKYADLWHPTGMPPSDVREGSARVNELAGRKVPASIRFQAPPGGNMAQLVDLLGAYRDAGCIQAAVDLKIRELPPLLDAARALIEASKPLRG